MQRATYHALEDRIDPTKNKGTDRRIDFIAGAWDPGGNAIRRNLRPSYRKWRSSRRLVWKGMDHPPTALYEWTD